MQRYDDEALKQSSRYRCKQRLNSEKNCRRKQKQKLKPMRKRSSHRQRGTTNDAVDQAKANGTTEVTNATPTPVKQNPQRSKPSMTH